MPQSATYQDWERHRLIATAAPVYKRKFFAEASGSFTDRFTCSMSGNAFKNLLLMLREQPEQVLANAADFAQLAIVLRGAAHNLNLLASVITTRLNPIPAPKLEEARRAPRPADQETPIRVFVRPRWDFDPKGRHSGRRAWVEWYTPPDMTEAARATMGSIDLDPCSIVSNPTGARLFYTSETNGLDKDWFGNVWLNGPFGEGFVRWMHKANVEFASGRVSQMICLIPAWTNGKWFQSFGDKGVSLCFPRPIRFINGLTLEPGKPAMSPNVIVYLGHRHDEFAQQFGQFGLVVRGLSNQ